MVGINSSRTKVREDNRLDNCLVLNKLTSLLSMHPSFGEVMVYIASKQVVVSSQSGGAFWYIVILFLGFVLLGHRLQGYLFMRMKEIGLLGSRCRSENCMGKLMVMDDENGYELFKLQALSLTFIGFGV
jgi:hypothetical protein